MGKRIPPPATFVVPLAALVFIALVSFRDLSWQASAAGEAPTAARVYQPIPYASPAFDRLVHESIRQSGSRSTLADFYRLMNAHARRFVHAKHAKNLFASISVVQRRDTGAFTGILSNNEQQQAAKLTDLNALLQFLGTR